MQGGTKGQAIFVLISLLVVNLHCQLAADMPGNSSFKNLTARI
jgi:hypothetical protein